MDEEKEEQTHLSREQKLGITLLFVFALLTLGLGFLQMRNNLVSPFVLRKSDKSSKSLQDFQVELQNVDTDRDGLNDYEELNFQGTSPYLPDTDSDGQNDKDEIEAGTDPLCAAGTNCENLKADIPPSATTTTRTAFSPPTTGEDVSNPNDINQALGELETLFNEPEKIRELLRKTGKIPEAQLNKFDNETLIRILKEVLEAGANPYPTDPGNQIRPVSNTSTTTVTTSTSQ